MESAALEWANEPAMPRSKSRALGHLDAGGVEHHGAAEGAHYGYGAHVDDELPVAEGGAALAQYGLAVAHGAAFFYDGRHVVGREKLGLLYVHGLAGFRRGNHKVRLAAQECRYLQDVHDVGCDLGLVWQVDVGQHWHAEVLFHPRKPLETLLPGPASYL